MSKLGDIWVELALDKTRYETELAQMNVKSGDYARKIETNFTKANAAILQSATTTSLNIDRNWQILGQKSDVMYNAMRQNAVNAYEMIRNHAGSTATDIIRAEQAKNATLTRLNEEQFGRQFSLLDTLKKNWMGVTVVMAGAYGAAGLAKTFIDASLAMERINTSMQAVAGTRAASELKFVRDEAQRLGLVANDASMAYIKFAASTKNTAIEGEATRKIFVGVSEAVTAMRLSSEEANGAFIALSQMASKGTISAEELRQQLGERLPGAIQIMADALGMNTRELFKNMEQGKLLAEEVLPKFAEQLHKVYGESALNAADKGQAAINRFNSTLTETKTLLGDALMPMFTRFLNVANAALKTFNEFGAGATTTASQAGWAARAAAYRAGGDYPGYQEQATVAAMGNVNIASWFTQSPATATGKKGSSIVDEAAAKKAEQLAEQFSTWQFNALQLNSTLSDTDRKMVDLTAQADKFIAQGIPYYEVQTALETARTNLAFAEQQKELKKTTEEAEKMALEDARINAEAQADIASQTQKSLKARQEAHGKYYDLMEALRDSEANDHVRSLNKINQEEKKAVELISDAWLKGPMSVEATTQYLTDLEYVHKIFNDRRLQAEENIARQIEKETERERRELIKRARENDDFWKGREAAVAEFTRNQIRWGEVGYRSFADTWSSSRDAFRSIFKDALTGDLKDIGDYWDTFLDSMAGKFADTLGEMATNDIFSVILGKSNGGASLIGALGNIGGALFGGGDSGGFLSGAIDTVTEWLGFHTGGIVGHTDQPVLALSAGIPDGVPRYATGLNAGEFPAILHESEVVLTKMDAEKMGAVLGQFLALGRAAQVMSGMAEIMTGGASLPGMSNPTAGDFPDGGKSLSGFLTGLSILGGMAPGGFGLLAKAVAHTIGYMINQPQSFGAIAAELGGPGAAAATEGLMAGLATAQAFGLGAAAAGGHGGLATALGFGAAPGGDMGGMSMDAAMAIAAAADAGVTYHTGTDYVPREGWYKLDRGEAVLTAEENRRRSDGGALDDRPIVLQFNLYASVADERSFEDFAEKIYRRIEKLKKWGH